MRTKVKKVSSKHSAVRAGINGARKGLVIIAVLWMVVVLMVMVAVLGRKSRLDMKVCSTRMEAVRCKWACRAGIEKAIAVLNEDAKESDSLKDLWSDNAEDFTDVMLDRCWFTVQVIDEASKLNINAATKEQLLGLPRMVEDIADAIVDWRDSDDMPSGGGVESGYYEGLSFGYMARNGPFRTIRELLLVKDVTEELFYGEDTNLNGQLDYNERDGDENPPADNGDDVLDQGWAAYLTCYSYDGGESGGGQTSGDQGQTSGDQGQTSGGQGQTSAEQQGQTSGSQGRASGGQGQTSGAQGQTFGGQGQTSGSQGPTSGDQGQTSEVQEQTSGDQGQASGGQQQASEESTGAGQVSAKVNVNTAPDIVLAALLGGGDEAERTAQSIISYRENLMYGIENISELVDERIVSSEVFEQLQDYITVRSSVFTIRCTATAGRSGSYGATLQTEAVVDRSSSPYKTLHWYQGASN